MDDMKSYVNIFYMTNKACIMQIFIYDYRNCKLQRRDSVVFVSTFIRKLISILHVWVVAHLGYIVIVLPSPNSVEDFNRV